MFIYVKYDTDGFITAYQNTEVEGFTKVFVLKAWVNNFFQYPSKFRYDADKKVMLQPGNLPNVSLSELSEKQAANDKSIDQLTEGLTALSVSMATKEGE
ncbi:hypothetical protein DA798_09650 [Lactobacillus sp. PFC-70]|nr:hypothetical protein DA798_09650 [Lactobacillus sp. PFC-70]